MRSPYNSRESGRRDLLLLFIEIVEEFLARNRFLVVLARKYKRFYIFIPALRKVRQPSTLLTARVERHCLIIRPVELCTLVLLSLFRSLSNPLSGC